ncbi:MAG TPA: DUF4197 domain-containing protein [Bacteroidales bacterium]|nr:DUF4197 domain-containing protein [Bacteroidales bacterium]
MKRIIYALAVLSTIIVGSCDLINTSGDTSGLSNEEVINGLKTALKVGTDTSVTMLNAVGGYYLDEKVKIPFPQEAAIIEQNIDKIPGLGTTLITEFVQKMNRSAEDAASEAGGIFASAITNMSVSDGWEILNGRNPAATAGTLKSGTAFDSTAATQFLLATTYNQLAAAFEPKIATSLDKKLIGNVSASSSWSTITTSYNTVVENDFLNLLNLEPVNTDLPNYVTDKALDGLFYKIGQEEIKIRRDPWKWVTTTVGDILTKVFGGNK